MQAIIKAVIMRSTDFTHAAKSKVSSGVHQQHLSHKGSRALVNRQNLIIFDMDATHFRYFFLSIELGKYEDENKGSKSLIHALQ